MPQEVNTKIQEKNYTNMQKANSEIEQSTCCERNYELLKIQIQQQQNFIQQQVETTVTLTEQQKKEQQEIEELKQTLAIQQFTSQNKQSRARPELKNITRKVALSPKARTLYETTVKLKRDKRHLKRLILK